MKQFKVRGTVWRWPGYAGWHFITLPRNLSIRIKGQAKTYGSGFVKIKAKIGGTSWNTALFPHTQSKGYLLAIKNSIRKKEGILEGDTISVQVTQQ